MAMNAHNPKKAGEAPERLLIGAEEIAAHVGISARQVYAIKDKGAPIKKIPGLGLAVKPSVIDAYLEEAGG